MSSEKTRLAAKRFNKLLERLSQAALAIGLAISTAAIVSMIHQRPRTDLWIWSVVGAMLIVFSVIVPIWLVSEE